MSTDSTKDLARDLLLIGSSGAVGGLSDAELVGRFAGKKDGGAEVAFEALVKRHGGTVMGTCRRVLGNSGEADDAFQATFLVLARKAGSVKVDDSIAPWLRGVARRVAGKALKQSQRRRAIEKNAAGPSPVAPEPDDFGPILFEELDRLPEKYRSPVVLCHLEGLTQEEAARQLAWPVGTVSGRLSRAKEMLRARLARRGLAPSTPLLVAAIARRGAPAAISQALIEGTAGLAIRFAGGGVVPESILTLTHGALTAMFLNQIKLAAIATSAIVFLGVGVGYSSGQFGSGAGTPPGQTATSPKTTPPPAVAVEKGTVNGAPVTEKAEAQPRVTFPKYKEKMKKQYSNSIPSTNQTYPQPTNYQTSSMVIVPSSDLRTLNVLSLRGGNTWSEYKVPEGLDSFPIMSRGSLLAVAYSGENIREVAVFNGQARKWSRQALREPVSDEIVPTVADEGAFYVIGRDVYAHSARSAKWGVLNLPGTEPVNCYFGCNDNSSNNMPGSPNAIIAQQGRKVYVFDIAFGVWSDPAEGEQVKTQAK